MITKKDRKRFKKFIKKYNVYKSFKINLKNTYGISFKEHCDEEEELILLINTAFAWEYTPEGYDYWDKLDDKWYDIVKDVKGY